MIDSQIYAELSINPPKDKKTKLFKELKEGETTLKFNYYKIRAILIAKLV